MARKKELQFEDFVSDVFSGSSELENELDYVEFPISKKVFVLIGIVAVLLSFLALGRILYLNVFKNNFYTARAAANVNREKLIPATRGVIVDKFGIVLAKNADTFSVFLNAGDLLKDRTYFNRTVDQLSEALGISKEEIFAEMEKANLENEFEIAVARNISSEQAIAVKSLDLDLVHVENDFRRDYIKGELFSSAIGYTGLSDTENAVVGKDGLESYYDKHLRGVDGVYTYFRDAFGEVLDQRVTIEPISGDKIEITLDAELQEYFYARLSRTLADLGLSAGAGIAINPKNGEILALISLPSFDNNIFTTPGKSEERVAIFNDVNKPLFNRALSGSYSPGSAIKPLVALAALREGVADAVYSVLSKGYIEIPNPYYPEFPSRFLDWKAHGWVNVRSALARSSNVYFYYIGGGFEDKAGLGINRLNHYWEKFGFGSKTGVDADFESNGFLPNPEEKEIRTGVPWRVGDTYNVSIGQGDFLVSPLQLVNFIASIANNGKIYRPYFVKKIFTEDGEIIANEEKVLVDYSNWTAELREVRAGMEDAVTEEYGTAHLLNNLGVSSAGKTGSAQIQNNTKTNAFFVGYAPINPEPDQEQIAILVLVEDAREGSLNAVPVARDVLAWYFENRIKNAQSTQEEENFNE